MVLPTVELKLLPVKIWEKLRNAYFGAQKRLRWPYSSTHNSESTWNIQVKFCTMSTDMLTHSLLNFHAIWRWSPGSLWPISNGMTQILDLTDWLVCASVDGWPCVTVWYDVSWFHKVTSGTPWFRKMVYGNPAGVKLVKRAWTGRPNNSGCCRESAEVCWLVQLMHSLLSERSRSMHV